jgi:hypothetical protein
MGFHVPALKPRAIKCYGSYQVASPTGSVSGQTGGAGHDVLSFRWASLTVDCIVWWVKWQFNVTTGFTAGQYVQHSLYKARIFSASPSGATSIVPATGDQKRHDSMADSVLTAFQIATTGDITIGTRTLEAKPMRTRGLWCPTTTIVQQAEDITPAQQPYLMLLTANGAAATGQGFVLQNDVTLGAGGVITLNVEVCWSEIKPDSFWTDDVSFNVDMNLR